MYQTCRSTLSSQRSLSSEDAGEIDLVHDNESFIAIGRSVLSGVKQNASENPWDFVPRRLRHAFFDAVKKRKQNLPMFPDPGEEESIILTRKLDNILPDSIPSWSKQLVSSFLKVTICESLLHRKFYLMMFFKTSFVYNFFPS